MAQWLIIEMPEPDDGSLGLVVVAGGLIWWFWSTVTAYHELTVPYYYAGWLFYHILILPIKYVFAFGGHLYDFFNDGLTPWGNLNWVLAIIMSVFYWIAMTVMGFFALYIYVPLVVLSGIALSLWAGGSWLFS